MNQADVTAVVLTLGEPYVERALASVRSQTRSAAEVLIVDESDASSFHEAINLAARRVRTDFFVQVDADMILDPHCIAALRSRVEECVGIVAGLLRDPLQGRISGIKLFRTECFGRARYRDHIACDSLFEDQLREDGWRRVSVLDFARRPPGERHTLGEHCPDYGPCYTFSKFRVLGARRRSRGDLYALLVLLQQLRTTDHPAAPCAQIGLAHGVLAIDRELRVQRYEPDTETDFVQRFLHRQTTEPAASVRSLPEDLRELFFECFRAGTRARTRAKKSTFAQTLAQLECEGAERAFVGTVGLCHGLFCDAFDAGDAGQKYGVVAELLIAPLPGTYQAADLLRPSSPVQPV